jgi:hypothetical protein
MEKISPYLLLICVCISSCRIDDGPDTIIRECDGFDFEVSESEWIILPEGQEYSFTGEGKTIELSSEYQISEPFTIEFENPGLSALIPIGLPNRNCFSSYDSFHNSLDSETGNLNEEIGINFRIGIQNNGERVDMFMDFNDIFFEMEIVNDTIVVDGNSISDGISESLLFQNLASLSLANNNFENVVAISNQTTGSQPQKIYLAKDFGLFAFEKNDTIWLRD